MIDPYDLTKPWDDRRLQEWFLFGICVAGKGARQTAQKLDRFLRGPFPREFEMSSMRLPFDIVQQMITFGMLAHELRKYKMGQYRRINKAFRGMVKIDPRTVTLEELEAIHGVGPKTARMLLLYTRPDLKLIPLDTHILHWLRDQGYEAPKSTPCAGPTYRKWELTFISEGEKRGMSPKEWDTYVWTTYANRRKSIGTSRSEQQEIKLSL